MSRLQQALDEQRIGLKSESYQMSIGELANLYESGELVLDPEFQRALRWSRAQQVAFIESVLLQLPLPSIFVAARDDGIWDLLDGLQRISTIFEFMGIRKQNGNTLPPLRLKGTERLPELEGIVFEGREEDPLVLPAPLKMDFKRERMDVKIILRESNADMKYDLFARLSLGGTPFVAQDIRNAIMGSVSSSFRGWIEELANNKQFLRTLHLSDREIKERYNQELLLIFLLVAHDDAEKLAEVGTFEDGLDESLMRLVRHPTSRLYGYDMDDSEDLFVRVFDRLDSVRGQYAFEVAAGNASATSGMRRDIYVVVVAAMLAALELGTVEPTAKRLALYLAEPKPPIDRFADAVFAGRALGYK